MPFESLVLSPRVVSCLYACMRLYFSVTVLRISIQTYKHTKPMTRIISFSNQKGGVSKSTSSVNVAHGLARAGYRVLLCDMDPQSNATYATTEQTEFDRTIYDLLVHDEVQLKDVVVNAGRIDLVPSDIDLAGAEVELTVGGQQRLKVKMGRPSYDYVIIDSPPSLGLLTVNCLAASDEVIIPVSCSVFALKGIARLMDTIEKVRLYLDRPSLRLTGVVCTLFDNTNVAKDVVSAIQQQFDDLAFDTIIPKNVKVEEAHSRTQSIFDYAPSSTGATAYQQLTQEIIDRG